MKNNILKNKKKTDSLVESVFWLMGNVTLEGKLK